VTDRPVTARAFDTAYADGGVPTWDIGRPQPAVVRLVESGAFGAPRARVLDAGCGTGEHALLLAAAGHTVVGVDVAPEAIRRARAKVERGRGPAPVFVVGDALALAMLDQPDAPVAGPGARPGPGSVPPGQASAPAPPERAPGGPRQPMLFDAALDVGLFHVFGDADRPRYATSLAAVVRPGGRAFVLCWSEHNPFGLGPRHVTRRELRATFRASAGWRVDRIDGEELASLLPGRIHAWLVRLTRRS
jgi:SAM-dependent methyltransferase